MKRLARAAAVLYAFRLVAGFLVAYPAAKSLGLFGAAPFADGDRVLFAPGGFELVEALRLGSRALSSVLSAASLGALALSLVGVVPLAAAIVGLGAPREPVSRWFARAFPRLPAFVLLWGTAWLARVVYAAFALLAISGATHATKQMVNEMTGDVIVLGVGAGLALGLVVLDLWHDLARTAVIEQDEPPLGAITLALRILVLTPRRVFDAAIFPGLVAIVAIGAGASLTGLADVSKAGAARVAAVFAVHQAVVFGLSFLRVYWLGSAAAIVAAGGSARRALDRLAVDLDVPASGAVPGQIEPHDATPE